jgi:DNA-binding response OmpR family regulator
LRRSATETSDTVIPEIPSHQFRVGQIFLDTQAYKVICCENEIELTPNEFKLLHALMKNAGRVMTRDKLLAEVQGSDVKVIERTVDTHLFALRKKMGSCSEYIETIRGVGYRFRETGSEE